MGNHYEHICICICDCALDLGGKFSLFYRRQAAGELHKVVV